MPDMTTRHKSEFIKDFLERKREIAEASQCSYRDFFTGKTVAVVGSSSSDTKNGEKIDDHDIVVRINSIIEYMPFSAEHRETMGSRLDVVYLAASKARRYAHLKQRAVWKSKDVKPKYAVLRTGKSGDALAPPMCRHGGASREKLEIVLREEGREDIKVFVSSISGALIHKHFVKKLSKTKLGVQARTGFLAIVDALLYGAKSVSIYNMTFYHGGNNIYWGPDKERTFHHTDPTHNSILEISILRDLIDYHSPDEIKYDDMLGHVLRGYDDIVSIFSEECLRRVSHDQQK